jgi:Tfp pilus assembly protein PilF
MAFETEEMASVILWAYSLYQQGQFEQAKVLADGVLTGEPDNAYLHALVASSLHNLSKTEEAIEEYTRTLQLVPEHIGSLANRGELLLGQGKLREAAEDLKKAIALDTQKNDPSANRARLLVQMTAGALQIAKDKGIEALTQAQEQAKLQLKNG